MDAMDLMMISEATRAAQLFGLAGQSSPFKARVYLGPNLVEQKNIVKQLKVLMLYLLEELQFKLIDWNPYVILINLRKFLYFEINL